MTGAGRAFLRLFSLQGSWNYERMQGVGMGYAAEPLLEDLKVSDPVRHTEAVVRSAEFFNANPYLAGIALGATARAEYDGVPGAQVGRLRTALAGPLGALGDGFFWAGLLPALIGFGIIAVVSGAGIWAVAGFLIVFNLARTGIAWWGLRTGLAAGMRVAPAVNGSFISGGITLLGLAAAAAAGVAVPMATGWLTSPFGVPGLLGVLAVATVGFVLPRWFGGLLTVPRFGLLALTATLLFRWVFA